MGTSISGGGTGSGYKYIASDTEGTSQPSSTAEVTIANATIPANIATTQLLITANIGFKNSVANGKMSTFRLKTGATGAETTKATFVLYEPTAGSGDANAYDHDANIEWLENTLTFTAETSVLVTCQHDDNHASSKSVCKQLLIRGN